MITYEINDNKITINSLNSEIYTIEGVRNLLQQERQHIFHLENQRDNIKRQIQEAQDKIQVYQDIITQLQNE